MLKTGIESEILEKRIELHLRKNNFGACREIVDTVEKEYFDEVQQDKSGGREITTLAELRGITLQVVNSLEERGYLYLQDLEGIDVENLYKEIPQVGKRSTHNLSVIVKKAMEHNRLVKKQQLKESNAGRTPIGTR